MGTPECSDIVSVAGTDEIDPVVATGKADTTGASAAIDATVPALPIAVA